MSKQDLKYKEQEKLIKQTKEYLFILENQIEMDKIEIKSLKKQLNSKNKEINQIKKLNKKISHENTVIKSTFSWKITKPLRLLKNLFK